MYKSVRELLTFINESPSSWHTVETSADMLSKNGFEEIQWQERWKLEKGKKYFTKVYGSSIFAFTVGDDFGNSGNKLRISAAHTDFPGFRLKPQSGIVKDGYGVLNVEGYGGMILYSWLDRPLSMAGKIALKTDEPFKPEMRLVDFQRPLMTIPSLAIHMNRDVNKGTEINKQKHMLPLVGVLGNSSSSMSKDFVDEFLSLELSVKNSDILSYELNLYPYENPCQLGMAGELVSSPRLDNLTSCLACLKGIISSGTNNGINIVALFDNEEIGSRTKQGAASTVLNQLLERIYDSLGCSRSDMWTDVAGGFMLSVDVAHGVHPNYNDKSDPTNRPVLNGGVVIKEAAAQTYAGDAEAIAVVKGLCQANEIAHQVFVNRNDMASGSTLGSIASAQLPIRTMDIGVPLLAMHSARETMGAADQEALNRLLTVFHD